MFKNILHLSLLAGLALISGSEFAAAQQPTLSLKLVKSFTYSDPPYTLAGVGGINDHSDIAGTAYSMSTGVEAGIIRHGSGNSAGRFSTPFVDPDATDNLTVFTGVNDSSTVCGFYYASANSGDGFLLSNGTLTDYVAPVTNVSQTRILAIDNEGDFGGDYFQSGSSVNMAFLNEGGTFSQVIVPGANFTSVTGINNLREDVGTYTITGHRSGTTYGFYRAADGTLTYPIQYPGAINTLTEGVNDDGIIVGWYTTGSGTHGFALQLPNTFVSYDVPKPQGNNTELHGISSVGTVSGSYLDRSGQMHGIILQAETQ